MNIYAKATVLSMLGILMVIELCWIWVDLPATKTIQMPKVYHVVESVSLNNQTNLLAAKMLQASQPIDIFVKTPHGVEARHRVMSVLADEHGIEVLWVGKGLWTFTGSTEPLIQSQTNAIAAAVESVRSAYDH